MTQQLRHLFGPDARAYSANLTAIVGLGTKGEKGFLKYLRGINKGKISLFDGVTGAIGLPTLSGELGITDLYFSGTVNNIDSTTFFGKYHELNLGYDVGVSAGVHASYAKTPTGNVYGFGVSGGIGVSPIYGIDFNYQFGIVSPFKFNSY